MAGTYKTPGVYVEEIVKFPPSVAEVETAIPAFVGYTQKAKKLIDGDLKNVPTRIKSLLEYEQYFGQGPEYNSVTVVLDDNNVPIDASCSLSNSNYVLYDSIRLFFDNGGGPCYIVSVGTYGKASPDAIDAGDNNTGLKRGLEELKKYDEPTLILFPDAVSLPADKLGSLQQAALLQCATLGDRFTIMDIKDSATGNTLDTDVDAFRNYVGMNNLKYGAAYHPHLKTVYDKKFRFRTINSNITVSSVSKKIKDLMKDTDLDEKKNKIKDRLADLEKIITDNDNITKGIADFIAAQASGDNFDAIFKAKILAIQNGTEAAPGAGTDAFNFLWDALANIDCMLVEYAAAANLKTKKITNTDFNNAAILFVKGNVIKAMQDLIDLDSEVASTGKKLVSNGVTYMAANFKSTDPFVLGKLKATTTNKPEFITATVFADKISQLIAKLRQILNVINNAFVSISQMGVGYEDTQEASIIQYIPFYKAILNTLNAKVTTVPPSGAIAGVFASVDNDRGVWKAPANVSLNSVISVSEFVDDSIQENLNVDPNAGKSINVIRPFSGKGIIVWGARTLAGNDNEWRYVPVRRFFNFAEESCKKSTSWAVFEPNDANTWTRISGQLDNFFNNLWRRGALAGAKPEHAYYIKCGLNVTMTPQDILEGRLIVEIGLAAVRPAEFIVLRFSHKLQQS